MDSRKALCPGWMDDYPGVEDSLRRFSRALELDKRIRSFKYDNHETKEEAEKIINLAIKLRRKINKLEERVSFSTENCKKSVIESYADWGASNDEEIKQAFFDVVLGTDPSRMDLSLTGLISYLQNVVDEPNNLQRSNNRYGKKHVVRLTVRKLVKAGIPVTNATAKKFDEAIAFVFLLADTEMPNEKLVQKVKRNYRK